MDEMVASGRMAPNSARCADMIRSWDTCVNAEREGSVDARLFTANLGVLATSGCC